MSSVVSPDSAVRAFSRSVEIPLYHLDTRAAARPCERAVPRDERRVQRFCKCQVGGIVRRETVPKLPDSFEQGKMRVSSERKVNENAKRLSAAIGGD